MNRLALALLVAAAATSCNRPEGFTPTPIAFASHPSVLRGSWSGTTTAGQRLRLELTAAYESSSTYQVTGTGSLQGETLTVTGTVVGGSIHSYLKAQTSLIPEAASLTLKRASQPDLNLNCYAYGGDESSTPVFWQCFLPDIKESFNLTRQTP